MSTTNLIQDISLIEFYESKTNNIDLVDYDKMLELQKKNGDYFDCIGFILDSISNKGESIKYNIQDSCDLVLDILHIGKDKISLVGLSVLQILSFVELYEFDLYFHSCDIVEANILLQRCLEIIIGNIEYLVDDACVIITLGDYCIRIHLELYKDRLEILRNNGPSPERHGYDPEIGYFGTLSAVILLIKEVVPICTDAIDQILEEDYKLMHMFYDIKKDCDRHNSLREVLYNYNGEIVYCTKIQKHPIYTYNSVMTCKTNIFIKPFVKGTSKVDVQKYLGKNYYPITIGISNDRYIALSGIRKKYGIMDDVFKLICSYWLIEEITLAKDRLLK